MTAKYFLYMSLSACLFCVCLLHAAYANNFLLEDFVEASSDDIAAIVPKLPAAYPNARFLISGYLSPSGKLEFIRVENTNLCEGEACPTLVVHERVEWKVLILAKKQIEISVGPLNEGSVVCKLFSKANAEIIVRYSEREKILFVAQ